MMRPQINTACDAVMALKPTIYKFDITLSDMDRNHYSNIPLTVAQHPSETLERMMVRVLAYCLNASEHLAFTAGLSTPDSPDINAIGLDGQFLHWIDVGEPTFDRIKKATRQASDVAVYTFNSKSDVWWSQVKSDFSAVKASVYQFDWEQVQSLAKLCERKMDVSVSVSDQVLFIAAEKGEVELPVVCLQSVN